VKMRAGEAATSPRWPGIHAFIEAELAANAAEPITPLPQAEGGGARCLSLRDRAALRQRSRGQRCARDDGGRMMFMSGYVGPSFSHIWKLGSALSALFFFKCRAFAQPLSGHAR